MTQEEVRAKYEARRIAENEAYSRGEEVAIDKVLNDAREGITREDAADFAAVLDEIIEGFNPDISIQGYDPRAHQEEPEEAPGFVDLPDADRMLEIWYLYRTAGNLATAKMLSASMGSVGVNEALAAALYVEDTPGFRREIVMHAQSHRGEPDLWKRWFGNWPDNQRLAEVIYETFRTALDQSLKIAPFRILTTPIWTPDHLEQADAMNEKDLTERNREWQKRRREELTQKTTNPADFRKSA